MQVTFLTWDFAHECGDLTRNPQEIQPKKGMDRWFIHFCGHYMVFSSPLPPRCFLCTGFVYAQVGSLSGVEIHPTSTAGSWLLGGNKKTANNANPREKGLVPNPSQTSSPNRFPQIVSTRRQRQRFNVGLLNGNGRLNILMPRSCWRNQVRREAFFDDFLFCLMRTAWKFLIVVLFLCLEVFVLFCLVCWCINCVVDELDLYNRFN